jgi:hypothetical protein
MAPPPASTGSAPTAQTTAKGTTIIAKK